MRIKKIAQKKEQEQRKNRSRLKKTKLIELSTQPTEKVQQSKRQMNLCRTVNTLVLTRAFEKLSTENALFCI